MLEIETNNFMDIHESILNGNIRQFAAKDYCKLFFRYWLAKKNGPCVIYLHGLESHSDWFINMAEALNACGYNVYAFDRRGSGLNQSLGDDPDSAKHIFDDLESFVKLVKKENPESKIFIIGLCLGGKIAVNAFLYIPNMIDGLVLISPAIKSKIGVNFFAQFSIVYSSYFAPERLFRIPIEDHMFTANPKYLEFIRKDPIRLRYISARHLLDITLMDRALKRATENIKAPVLLLLAGIDDILDMGAVDAWFDSIPSPDKTKRTFNNCRHILTFEEKSQDVITCIADWIRSKSKKENHAGNI